jgi:hypothetical protein
VRRLGEGLNDVPALFFGGGDNGADGGEIACSVLTAGPAGDFRLDPHHAQVAFGLIVGEGYSGIVEKAQRVLLWLRIPFHYCCRGASW